MPRKVAVVGVGQTECKTRNLEVSFPGLVHLAVRRALDDAGLTLADIDAVVFGSSPEYFEGVNHPEFWCGEASGGWMKPQMRIHTGGTVGAASGIAAFYHVASGVYDTVLAVTADKLSEGVVQLALSTVYDPIFGRQFACGAPSAVAIQSRCYMTKYGATEEHSAKIAVKNRLNALKNPYAHLKIPNISIEMVLNSPYISEPIRLLDACPASDGACAMVFAAEGRAEKIAPKPAWVHAVSAMAEGVGYADRDWTKPLALNKAAKKAYAQAGIDNPRAQLDCVEMYEAFTYQEMIWSEGMYLCGEGEGMKLLDEGATQMDGDLPINASGGVLSTNTIGASAMQRQAEVALQIMGKAGEHQLPKVNLGAAHGWGGGIQFHTIMILGAAKP